MSTSKAACTEDPTLSPPVVVRFNGASLTNDGQLEHCLPKVDMDANQALVLIPTGPPAHRPVRTAPSDFPPTSEQSKTSDSRLAVGKYDMQELVKCIAAELKSVNLSVWMDIERGIDSVPLMNGDILDK
ncbi:hypothetical protein HDU82_001034 [Entophlyctis luteolus]|nr:hypothetical protein HDU82_001034 [Entophlyctis luteolus]